jgi:hypothetical protein
MDKYSITARRINDRPDPGGWYSGGTDLPTFSIEAANAENAADIAHSIAGNGAAGITRTIVQTYRETEDGGEEYTDTTRWWTGDGRPNEPTRVLRQYGYNGRDITGDLCAEQEADTVAWFTHDAEVWLHLSRSPRGKWEIAASDFVTLTPSHHRHRFATPDAALYWAERRARTRVIEVDEW